MRLRHKVIVILKNTQCWYLSQSNALSTLTLTSVDLWFDNVLLFCLDPEGFRSLVCICSNDCCCQISWNFVFLFGISTLPLSNKKKSNFTSNQSTSQYIRAMSQYHMQNNYCKLSSVLFPSHFETLQC